MKYVKQLGIILAVSFMGEVLRAILPLPIPGSIYGLLLMLIALKTEIIPLHKVKNNFKAIVAGIVSGVLTSLTCVLVLSILFKLEHAEYVTLLPKGITIGSSAHAM